MKIKARISLSVDDNTYDYKLFETLDAINKLHSQRKAAKHVGVSHSVLNRRILKAEKQLDEKLVDVTPRGSYLTEFARDILDEYETYMLRLNNHDSMIKVAGGPISCEFLRQLAIGYNLANISFIETDPDTAYDLANMGMVDILGFDDPVLAYIHNLEPIPLGRDYLKMLIHPGEVFNSIYDLEDLSFIEVENSAQRLVWNSLVDFNVNFNIVSTVSSFHEAIRLVENDPNLYTFINNSMSYISENTSNVLEDNTSHIISALNVKNDSLVESFLNFASHNAQKTTVSYGFKHLLDE